MGTPGDEAGARSGTRTRSEPGVRLQVPGTQTRDSSVVRYKAEVGVRNKQ